MIIGTINDQREAIVPLRLIGADGKEHVAQAILDTGFNGHLTLPRSVIDRLRVSTVGQRWTTLGDGSKVLMDVFRGTVSWHGRNRKVPVLHSEDGPFIGMGLLLGSRVTLDVAIGGTVTIGELKS